MSRKSMKKPLSVALGAAFLAGGAATVFAAADLDQGYQVGSIDQMELLAGAHDKKAEGSCGEGKCGEDKGGEGKCGEGKCGEDKDKGGEGKCGEGKCGAA